MHDQHQSDATKLHHSVMELRKTREAIDQTGFVFAAGLKPYDVGYAVEFFVKAALLLAGVHFFETPHSQTHHCDLLVVNSMVKHFRCEVKGCRRLFDTASFRKSGYERGTSKTVQIRYSAEDKIDFLILAVLHPPLVFVIPFVETACHAANINASPRGWVWKYLNRLELFEQL